MMNQTIKYHCRNKSLSRTGYLGFTLVECLIVMFILMIALGGTLGFRYHSVLGAERAESQILAARASQVILEAWRGQKGASDFDPTQQGFDANFQVQAIGFSFPVGMKAGGAHYLGFYQIDIEGRTFRAVLTYEDAAGIPNARALYITLRWRDTNQKWQDYTLSTLTRTSS